MNSVVHMCANIWQPTGHIIEQNIHNAHVQADKRWPLDGYFSNSQAIQYTMNKNNDSYAEIETCIKTPCCE